MSKVCIVGIAGGSASGKTTIVNMIKEYFQNDIELISHDSYYWPHDDMPLEERSKLNYDHPSSFETDKMIEDVKQLKAGHEIYRPVYDYAKHTRAKETVLVEPKRVIIVEGILILEDARLRELMDIKVFVDTDADERLMRRIVRDIHERGRSIESVLTQYAHTVKPMHEQFVEPSKKYANIIIPKGGENTTGVHILQEHLKLLLQKSDSEA